LRLTTTPTLLPDALLSSMLDLLIRSIHKN
jgi:hypothetical protein